MAPGGLLGADGRPVDPAAGCPHHVLVPLEFTEHEDILTGETTWVASIIFCFTCGARGPVNPELVRQIRAEERAINDTQDSDDRTDTQAA